MTDTYTLHYETPDAEITLPGLPLLDLVSNLFWLQDNETLTHDDFLEILDSEGNHVHNSIEHIDSLVDFVLSDPFDTVRIDAGLEDSLYAIGYGPRGVKISYRLKNTQEWTTYYND